MSAPGPYAASDDEHIEGLRYKSCEIACPECSGYGMDDDFAPCLRCDGEGYELAVAVTRAPSAPSRCGGC